MRLSGNWLLLQSIVTTALYKLLRLVFIAVQSIFWQLNGTARELREARLPHNYDRSAHVLDVVLRHKFCQEQAITVDNFLCTHNRFEHPRYIVDNDNVSLMIVNERDAVFCEPAEKGERSANVASVCRDLGAGGCHTPRVSCGLNEPWGCILAPPGEYKRTIRRVETVEMSTALIASQC